MSTQVYNAYHSGALLGVVAYQHCADVWCGGLWDDEADYEKRRWWSVPECLSPGMHTVEWIDVYSGTPDDYSEHHRLKACVECRVLYTPPHDGYATHQYDCPRKTSGWSSGYICACKRDRHATMVREG